MRDFAGRLAVITGGGTGMGRELARALATEGCHLALCDLSEENMAETRRLCEPSGVRVSTHRCDVADEAQVLAFRDAVAAAHGTDQVHLLFNNAGIGGGGSITDPDAREQWDRTFAICWGGVYYCTRAFLPMLMAAPAAHIVNTSSINGFWASVGPQTPHTAYSAAKFAVKGFTEALITDLRLHAPHVKCSVVMPGHIGTQIVVNSTRILERDPDALSADEIAEVRRTITEMGLPVDNLPDDAIRELMRERMRQFESTAPTTAAQAVAEILDGVRAERWRILVGDDARVLDEAVRGNPEQAYEPAFLEPVLAAGHLTGLVGSISAANETR
ncbi:MAG: SDR family oxidoreductase [Pseudomonadales bacterium]|jgi:NAD(P)-dependent dehydrogenase (short-subunit alcohol dehydrogenase family)|nr:SDR family oxidoreductase [Pseudomonadales bacterium]